MSSNSVRSLVKPALHVGEQIDGGFGWRACTGRAGTAGGATTAGGDGGELCAQPLTSVSSSIGVSARTRQLFFGFMDDPLQRFGAALFLGPGGGFSLARGPFQPGQVLGMLGPCGGMVGLLGGQTPGLQAGCHDRQHQRDG